MQTYGEKPARPLTAQELASPKAHRVEVAETKKEIIDSYDHRPVESPAERRRSPVYHVRTVTNWVKSSLITMFARPGARVLDLGCGHGTDLLKYSINHIGEYVGVDISVESLREAVRRYNAYNPTFNATFVHADLTQQSINRDDVLEPGMVFDMVASNLTLQFAWTSEIAVRTYLRNATDRLLPGGYIIGCFPDPIKIMQHLVASPDHTNVHIGNICTLKFRKYLDEINQTVDPFAIIYDVTLGEVMKDIPEYLISLPTLEKVALEYGLEPRLMLNFHDFYNSYRFLPPFRSLLAKHDAPEDIAAIPADEWDVLSLYTVFVFQKQIGAPMRRLGALSETDIISVE